MILAVIAETCSTVPIVLDDLLLRSKGDDDIRNLGESIALLVFNKSRCRRGKTSHPKTVHLASPLLTSSMRPLPLFPLIPLLTSALEPSQSNNFHYNVLRHLRMRPQSARMCFPSEHAFCHCNVHLSFDHLCSTRS